MLRPNLQKLPEARKNLRWTRQYRTPAAFALCNKPPCGFVFASIFAMAIVPAEALATTVLAGTDGSDGASIGLNDTVVATTQTTGIDSTKTDLTTLPGINNGDQISVTINDATTTIITINTGDTLQDLAARISAVGGAGATVTTTRLNDNISITPDDINTKLSIANVVGTPLSATGIPFSRLPGIIDVVSTPGGDGTDGGAALSATAITGSDAYVFDERITGGNGGRGGTTAYNRSATDGGDGGDGGTGLLIDKSLTGVYLLLSSSGITGGDGGAGGAGSGGGNNGADGDGGIGIFLSDPNFGALDLVNYGTVSGGLSGDGVTRNYAIYLANSGNTLRLFNGSVFNGDVFLGTGNGTFVLQETGSEDADFSGSSSSDYVMEPTGPCPETLLQIQATFPLKLSVQVR